MYMGFSLEWLLKLRKSELSSIELELANINSTISENLQKQKKNNEFILKLKNNLNNCTESWEILSLNRSILSCENIKISLDEEFTFLQKEKTMIYEKYKNKNKGTQLLEKVKDTYIEEVKQIKSKKQQAEINELSLLIRKDE